MSLPPWIYGVSTMNSLRALRRIENNQDFSVEKEEPFTQQELEFIETVGTCPIQIPFIVAFALGLTLDLIKQLKKELDK